jgi:O-antigen biosynthesis protein WbqP
MPVNTGDIPRAQAGSLKITRVGKLIRRLNIDELPQLFNVLRGQMSIVGPRPVLPSQSRVLRARRRNGAADLKPGLTGLAQVNSFDGMTDETKAEWDGRYAESVTFIGDVTIGVRTFGYLTKRPPVY